MEIKLSVTEFKELCKDIQRHLMRNIESRHLGTQK